MGVADRGLNSWSAQFTGGGLTASKKRNIAKAAACSHPVEGWIISSTIQKATISSHTMQEGSDKANSRAVRVQAQMPKPMPAAISSIHCTSSRKGSNTRKLTHDHSVPTVPGARGDRPLPIPRAIQRAGWPNMKPAVGRRPPATALGCEVSLKSGPQPSRPRPPAAAHRRHDGNGRSLGAVRWWAKRPGGRLG